MPSFKNYRYPFAHRSQTWLIRGKFIRLASFALTAILPCFMLMLVTVIPSIAQPPNVSGNPVDGFPVVLEDNVLFRVKEGVPGVVSAQERAEVISKRLADVADNDAISPDAITVNEQDNASIVKVGDTVLFTVRENDAVASRQPRQTLAEQTVGAIKTSLKQYREEHSFKRLVAGIGLTAFSTLLLFIFLRALQVLASKLLVRIRAARAADRLDLRMQNFQLLGSESTSYLLTGFVQLAKLALILGSLYLYIPFVLSQFLATKPCGDRIFSDIAGRANQLLQTFAQYLPNLITIAIIAFLTYYAIGFSKLVITELGRDDAYPWFYPEWVQPTIRLVIFLILAIACVVAFPYLPGFGSPAFQGISLFLGALLSLGGSSSVANAISGVILIYTRAFQLGDVIQIGEVKGEVAENTLFVTRILTFKKEIVTLTNSSVLSSSVTNFSAILRESGGYLLLHTTVTLGYDVPWSKIYEVLIEAAKATKGIVSEPQPFVLQTSLNDYNVGYELNAYTDRPEWMPKLYSELHQNIQDYCNQAGIEILSPAYTSIRDGNHSTIPTNYLPSDYIAPGFKVRDRTS